MASDRDVDHLETMLELIAHLERRTQPLSLSDFEDDEDEVDLAAFRVGHIGEESSKLSPEIKARHPEIDWKNLYGMRNIISHTYTKILARAVWQAVQRHLEPLKVVCQAELDRLLK
ncbi:DUF86 domain-containing protein [Sphingomonas crocodyli]|uniref:DUF86 domain-containing protein n=1 Tax=Sphingomonas crocodyli TaxID=1979270 RepID=A0A437M8L5_9SPHN|nr:HepT-like ribonuclease domain-containing protein [Sphingomonas crocodyli]RVT93927.1 DUF86 domain-containing protein [Sphingomonas crocodyli]